MNPDTQLHDSLLLQPVAPGTVVPSTMPAQALFLLNLSKIVAQDVWDNMGTKEQFQASQIRAMAGHLIKIADLLDELGLYLSALPDAYDYENGEYEQSWDEMNEEADTLLTDDYNKLSALIDELTEASFDDFMN